MAQFEVLTTEEERSKLLTAIASNEGKTVAVSKLATVAGLSASRARYALQDLVDSGRVERRATKAFNPHYVRYAYYISKEVKK